MFFLRQQAWKRPDGQPATREHLLMALADIDTLLIQASYTQRPAESRCPGQGGRAGRDWAVAPGLAAQRGAGGLPALPLSGSAALLCLTFSPVKCRW